MLASVRPYNRLQRPVTVRALALMIALAFTLAPGWSGADTCPKGRQSKGVELYSWRTAEGGWMFAMLPRTNRQKSEAEIEDSSQCFKADVRMRK